MRKNLTIIFIAILLGSLFALYIFKGVDKTFATVLENNEAYLYQVGVFKVYENALNEKNKYISAIIINDNDLYRVYIALAYDKELKESYEKYFKKLNIIYYPKKIELDKKCLNKINSYESLVKKSNKEDIYFKINKILLDYYKGGCND